MRVFFLFIDMLIRNGFSWFSSWFSSLPFCFTLLQAGVPILRAYLLLRNLLKNIIAELLDLCQSFLSLPPKKNPHFAPLKDERRAANLSAVGGSSAGSKWSGGFLPVSS
ncbi:hypothetical protein VNO77_19149 [Canavalia gladiata]|uniref:Uncharacterized protein n=1 Tax=Canavalia gladiata TaxID=3824 RepID=A0AAN9LM85_CANGL